MSRYGPAPQIWSRPATEADLDYLLQDIAGCSLRLKMERRGCIPVTTPATPLVYGIAPNLLAHEWRSRVTRGWLEESIRRQRNPRPVR